MSILEREHVLAVEQIVPRSREEVFAFFADAENLERITPASLRFSIRSPLPILMAEGALIDYQLKLMGIPFRWRTRITRWVPGECFIDEQIEGPYAQWIHTHTFSDVERGTLVSDHVLYRLPGYPIGEVAYPLVRRQLRAIFDYRRESIARLIG